VLPKAVLEDLRLLLHIYQVMNTRDKTNKQTTISLLSHVSPLLRLLHIIKKNKPKNFHLWNRTLP